MGTARRRRCRPSGLVVGLLALTALVASASAASAHASLLSSDPAGDGVVETAPAEIRLHFNQPVSATYAVVAVTDTAGTSMAVGEPQTHGETVTQAVANLVAGTYTVSYRVVSTDGHPVSGRFDFGYAPAQDTTAQTPIPTSTSTSTDTTMPAAVATASPSASASAGTTTEAQAEAEAEAEAEKQTSSTRSVVVGGGLAGAVVLVVGGAGLQLARRRRGRLQS